MLLLIMLEYIFGSAIILGFLNNCEGETEKSDDTSMIDSMSDDGYGGK